MLEYSISELSEQLKASRATYVSLAAELKSNPDDMALAVCVKSLDSHIKDLVQELGAGGAGSASAGRAHGQLVAV